MSAPTGQQGAWVCPRCGGVNAWFVAHCRCKPPRRTSGIDYTGTQSGAGLNLPLARVLFERAQDGYVNPTGGKTTGRERKDS